MDEARIKMIEAIDKMIAGLQHNKEVLLSGGRLENEDWVAVAIPLRENMQLFVNQHIHLEGLKE